jgi:ComF family protein
MPSQRVCNRCDDFEFTNARACGLYSGALRASVLFLKTEPHLCGRVRNLIRKSYRDNPVLHSANLIVPIPLHPSRQKERGYNQALIVATELRRESRLPIDIWNLQRLKATDRHRAGLDSHDRSKDMKKAFKIDNPSGVANKTVLLVDDVFTTGATLTKCARIVKAAGAVDVKVFTIARVL